MDDVADRIRDIHLPPEPALWPPAPGWWALLALVGLTALLGLWWLRRRDRIKRAALSELAALEARWRHDGDASALAMGLSTLLRRVALVQDRTVAGLTGPAWLAWLGLQHRPELLTLPYGGPGAERAEELLHEVRRWMRNLPGRQP